jgi:hypothetical protein
MNERKEQKRNASSRLQPATHAINLFTFSIPHTRHRGSKLYNLSVLNAPVVCKYEYGKRLITIFQQLMPTAEVVGLWNI